jgi:hypothetical protein
MATLVYGTGPTAVTIDAIQTNEFSRIPIFTDDGASYLFTEFTIDVSGFFHATWPGTQSANAFLTDLAVRQRLLRPRNVLRYDVLTPTLPPAPGTVLTSPVGGATVDANNGPVPVFCNVAKVIGEANTFAVNYRIKTWLNECIRTDGVVGEIMVTIANRWMMSDTIGGEDYLTHRTVHGEARFDTGRLNVGVLQADQLRASYMDFPLPAGFKRHDVVVDAASDGSSCRYSFVDSELPIRINSRTTNNPLGTASDSIPHIVDMEVIYSHGLAEGSIGDAIVTYLLNGAQWTIGNVMSGMTSSSKAPKKRNPLSGMMFPKVP